MELRETGIVLEIESGKRIFNIYAIKSDRMYELQYFNGQKKILSGMEATKDSDFRSALPVSGDHHKLSPYFFDEGRIYTEGKETELSNEIDSLRWRKLEEAKIFLPFSIAQLLNQAIKNQSRGNNLFYMYYAYSFLLNPLHLFGIKGLDGLSATETFFISDTLFITPVLAIQR